MNNVFLTAFDPSDLPGGSIDPLGFERGYLHLAEKILPGMTNVADCPRYFGMICAGSLLANVGLDTSPKIQRKERGEVILRLERFWALANVLSFGNDSGKRLSGLRGVTYAVKHKERLEQDGKNLTDGNYKLLIRQVPYGALGIYGAVAENCNLLYKYSYELTPGLGSPLGEAFQKETDMPPQIRRAVHEDGIVSVDVLAKWGKRAYLWSAPGKEEARCISEMIKGNKIRHRFARILKANKYQMGEDNEQKRLQRIAVQLKKSPSDRDLWEAVHGIIAYERSYQLALLGFERLMYLCRNVSSGALYLNSLSRDAVIQYVQKSLPSAVKTLTTHIDRADTEHFKAGVGRLEDVLVFLAALSDAADRAVRLAEVLMERHTEVQRGKFDQGRKKLPWLQMQNKTISLTMTRVGGLTFEATSADDILAHPYRLRAADRWISAAGGI